uniref:Metalloendopeptidase n=1 Tax=Isarachnanthus nocturnus TaxID=1240238 RepID=A0A7G7WYS6_9CNID|nr:toxin candidate TRINITY_DN22063_c2_g1_i1 [Isarachnanthus nocturnus]
MARASLLVVLSVFVALVVTAKEVDIEEELLKEAQLDSDERVPIHRENESGGKSTNKVKLPKTASYKNEDDDIPDVEKLSENSHPDKVRFEDDIVLEKKKDARLWMLLRLPGYKDLPMTKISSNNANVRAIVTGPVNTLWPKAIVPFYIDKSRMHEEKQVLDAVRHLERHTCIRFPRLKNPVLGENYVRIVKGSWASSRLGIYPEHLPQNINLHDGFLTGNLVHEFMHALGFLHEHSRPDRSKYLLMSQRVKKRWNFRRADVRGLEWESMGVPYDYRSITHYSDMSMTPRDPRARKLMGQRTELTKKDVCQLNRMYKCYKKLDQLADKLNCDCLDSYTPGTCKWLKSRNMCVRKRAILNFICPNTCGVCCQHKCKVDFHKVGCFRANKVPVSKRGNPFGIFFSKKGNCRRGRMRYLDRALCRCARIAKKKKMKYFTVNKEGKCIGKQRMNFKKLQDSHYCRDSRCRKVQFSNVKCAVGEAHSLFLYKLKSSKS